MSPVSDHQPNPQNDPQPEDDYELRAAAEADVRLDGLKLSAQILSLNLVQKIDDHHELTLDIREIGEGRLDQFENPATVAGYLGKSLSLSITTQDAPDDALKFTGVVTQVQLISGVDGVSTTRITAHSPTIALDGAKRNWIFQNESLGDALQVLLHGGSMTLGKVDTGGESLGGPVQFRETDYAMVMRLASAYGYFAFYDGEEFQVRKANATGAVEVAFRETLGSFTLGLGTTQGRFETLTFSRLKTEEVSSNADSRSLGIAFDDFSRSSVDASESIFTRESFVEMNPPEDSATADTATSNAVARALGQMARCQGRSIVTGVKVGTCVETTRMGTLNGQFFVTQVVHNMTENGYANEFVCTPLDLANPRYQSRLNRATHLQSAVVTDNQDPEQLGRIRVKYCWSGGAESEWARIATFDAGPDRGAYFIPEIDDEVLIGFERGDPSQPVVLGSLFNSDAEPPAEAPDESNNNRMLQSRSGHKIIFCDAEGSEKIEIVSNDGKNSIVMSSADPSIVITSDGGALTLNCGDLKIEASGQIEMKADADVKIEAGANMELKAGANLDVKASANASLEGSANVKIQGGAQVEVKGAMIKLN